MHINNVSWMHTLVSSSRYHHPGTIIRVSSSGYHHMGIITWASSSAIPKAARSASLAHKVGFCRSAVRPSVSALRAKIQEVVQKNEHKEYEVNKSYTSFVYIYVNLHMYVYICIVNAYICIYFYVYIDVWLNICIYV